MSDGLLDVLVIGGGLAGLSAANKALEFGLSVTVMERSALARHECASRVNGGVFHVGFRSVHSDPEELLGVIRRATGNFGLPAVAKALADNARRSIDWLAGLGTDFTRMQPDDGWKDCVLAPLGFHEKTTMGWQGLGADLLIERMERRVQERGGRMIKGAQATHLLTENEDVVGVAYSHEGRQRQLRGRAVVIADGGFEGNQSMIRQYITERPDNLLLRGCESGHGDGIRMAQEIGANVLGMPSFYGHLLSADSLAREGLSPFPFLDFLASAGMLVDEDGNRFVDETAGGHFTSNALARRGSGLGYAIFDEAMWQTQGRFFFCPPNPNLVEAGGTLYKADSLEDLAVKLGLPAGKLIEQAATRSTPAREADDKDLTVYSKGRHGHQPFAAAPFYAAPACAALTSTLGGLEIDRSARVIRSDGRAINGLYAAGSATGGIEGGPEVGYLGGLIKALVFGLLAAEHIAAQTSAASAAHR